MHSALASSAVGRRRVGGLRLPALLAVIASLAGSGARLLAQDRIHDPIALTEAVRRSGGRVLVGLKPVGALRGLLVGGVSALSDFDAQAAAVRLGRRGLRFNRRFTLAPIVAGELSADSVASLMSDPSVEYVEPDVVAYPLDLGRSAVRRTARRAESTPWGVTQVTAPTAWASTSPATTGSTVKVGVLDSGGDYDHPDLLWAGGFDANTNNTAQTAWDDNIASCNGHGTHVAGTIGARQNSLGVVGVAPAVQLYALKVFMDFSGSCLAFTSTQLTAINWAVSNGIKVLNASIGGSSYSAGYDNTLQAAAAQGVYFVAAAGNDGGAVNYPAAYPSAFAIASLSSSNTISSFSSRGPQIFAGAPGEGITSTMPGGGWGTKSGTSMASPHAAGVIALMLARFPGISRANMISWLAAGALDVDAPGRDDNTGYGLLRAYNSFQAGSSGGSPLTFALSPASRRDSVAQGSTTLRNDSGTVTLSGDNSATTGWTASKLKSWTTLTTGNGAGSGRVRWTRNPTGLVQGTYVDTITVTVAGALGSPARIIDTLKIGPAPVPLTLAVSPASRRDSVVQGSTTLRSDSGTVTLSGDNSATTGWTASKRKSWTTLTTGSGTGSGKVRWTRNPTGLTQGTYVDTITVAASGAAGSPSRIIDTLKIGPAPVPLSVALSPASRWDSVVAGSTAPRSDSGTVTLSGDNGATTGWTASKLKSWTTLTTASGTGSGKVRWTRNPTGLAQGTYVDTITVVVAGALGSPARIIDTLKIGPMPVPLSVALSPVSRWDSVVAGSTTLRSDSGAVTLSGDNGATTGWTASKLKSWTVLTTGSGTGSGKVRWTRNPTGLGQGTYVDTITVLVAGAVGSPARIIDTLRIGPAPVALALALSPASRWDSVVSGSTTLRGDSGTVTLSGDNASTTGWTAGKLKSWTTLTTASGTGSGKVRWTRNPTGLAQGTYVDTITVTAAGGFGSPARIIDTLKIGPAPVALALAVSPASRRDSVVAGSTTLRSDSGTVTLSGDNSATTGWTASKLKSWTTLTTAGGTGSGKVRWTRNPAGLVQGTYVDTITVTVAGALGNPARIIDTLKIGPAPVPLSVALSPASRRDSVAQGSTVLRADSGSVTLAGDNASTSGWTASRQKSWTTLTTGSGTGSGKVRWTRNPSGLSAGIYVDTIRVSVAGALGSPAAIVDSFVIGASPGVVVAVKPKHRRTLAPQASSSAAVQLDSILVSVTGPDAAMQPWRVTTRAPWILLNTSAGQGDGYVRFLRRTSGLENGVHVDSLTIELAGSIQMVDQFVDTLVVGVTEPAADAAAGDLLGAGTLSADQREYLDQWGNRNGRYDVGDFLSFIDRTGVSPSAALMERVLGLPNDAAPTTHRPGTRPRARR